jgi:hypothetical protein
MSKIGYREVSCSTCNHGRTARASLLRRANVSARAHETTRTIGGVVQPVEIYFDDWREVEGIKYPFSVSQSSTSLKLGFTSRRYSRNVSIDAKLFQPPR